MAKSVNEQLSAFVDGELSLEEQQRLINRMSNDEDLKQAWEQYHAIGDSLRDNMPKQMPVNFARSVMIAIESEPLILAPNSRTQDITDHQAVINAATKPMGLGRRVAGFAIAASVATAAVIGLQIQTQTEDATQVVHKTAADSEFVRVEDSTLQTKIPKSNARLASEISPLAHNLQQQNQQVPLLDSMHSITMNGIEMVPAVAPDHSIPLALNDQLHKYLVNHNQNVAGSRVGGFMPYARIVANNPGGIKITDTQGQQ